MSDLPLIPCRDLLPRERGEGGKTPATLAFSPPAGRRCRHADEGLQLGQRKCGAPNTGLIQYGETGSQSDSKFGNKILSRFLISFRFPASAGSRRVVALLVARVFQAIGSPPLHVAELRDQRFSPAVAARWISVAGRRACIGATRSARPSEQRMASRRRHGRHVDHGEVVGCLRHDAEGPGGTRRVCSVGRGRGGGLPSVVGSSLATPAAPMLPTRAMCCAA